MALKKKNPSGVSFGRRKRKKILTSASLVETLHRPLWNRTTMKYSFTLILYREKCKNHKIKIDLSIFFLYVIQNTIDYLQYLNKYLCIYTMDLFITIIFISNIIYIYLKQQFFNNPKFYVM